MSLVSNINRKFKSGGGTVLVPKDLTHQQVADIVRRASQPGWTIEHHTLRGTIKITKHTK